jgi:serine/threonine-protein kinase
MHLCNRGMETLLSTAGSAAMPGKQVPDSLPRGAKAGPWIVERELGRGGMGAVYAVVHDKIGKRAALKVVHGRLLGAGFNPDRMLVEARVVNQVGHPNIVDIFETGKLPDGRPYIVMERLEGQSLADRVDASKLEPEFAIAILRQICDALIAAHAAGIVHRDLKLDNVFLVDNLEDPSTPRVKILDWGIAKIVNHDVQHTVEGQLVGTPQYLSPEQARGGRVSPKTDVYSLGVMAFELFLDQLPFEAETSAEIMAMHLRATPPRPSELWPEIPPQLEKLLLEMLAKRADHRPTMLEVANRLEAIRLDLERQRRSSEIAAQARPASLSEPVPVQVPQPPQAEGPVPASASRSARLFSADALASTRLARWFPRARYWRYAVGGLVLIGGLALFLVIRGGDQAAAAAAASPSAGEAAATREAGAAEAIAAPDPAEAATPVAAPTSGRELDADARTPEVPEVPEVIEPEARDLAPAPPPRKPARLHTKPAGRVRSAASAAAPSAPIRRAPAAPRRNAKLDPDGTVDPYR